MRTPTLKELEAIKQDRDREKKRQELAISLGICPACGSKIIDEPFEKYAKPRKTFFGLFVKHGMTWDVRKVCPKNKEHYEEKYNHPTYDYGY
jgi:hypothetical protein